MPQLLKRILSAIAAALLIFTTYYYFKREGIMALSIGIVILGICEYARMAFSLSEIPKNFIIFYVVSMATSLVLLCFSGHLGGPLVFFLFPFYVGFVLWGLHNKLDNRDLMLTTLLSALGFIYLVCFSSLAIRFLLRWDTQMWFWLLLAIVIATDVFAYFGGLAFGKRKIMPTVSPKKTWAGSMGGLFGAGLVAYLFRNHIEGIATWQLVLSAVAASAFAQTGDLFESLIKRVANVKDSGNIMPGHGGILDRLDGILFAAPVIYLSSLLF